MARPCTVLIAARDLIEPLRLRLDVGGEVLTFADSEPLRALETITERRPGLVALERLFAASPRGAAPNRSEQKSRARSSCVRLDECHKPKYRSLWKPRGSTC